MRLLVGSVHRPGEHPVFHQNGAKPQLKPRASTGWSHVSDALYQRPPEGRTGFSKPAGNFGGHREAITPLVVVVDSDLGSDLFRQSQYV